MVTEPNLRRDFLASASAGLLKMSCMYPLDTIRARTQVQRRYEHVSRGYQSPLLVTRDLLRNEGMMAFFKGFRVSTSAVFDVKRYSYMSIYDNDNAMGLLLTETRSP